MKLCGRWFSVLWAAAMVLWPEPLFSTCTTSGTPAQFHAQAESFLPVVGDITRPDADQPEEQGDGFQDPHAFMLPNWSSDRITPVMQEEILCVTKEPRKAGSPTSVCSFSRGPPSDRR